MKKEINFDLDGTIVDFYNVDNWLDYLLNKDSTPYRIAKPRLNLSSLARVLNTLQKKHGYKINVITWLSKNSTEEFDNRVTEEKKQWLKKHLPSVQFDKIYCLEYGTPKHLYGEGILFDDEEKNRVEWNGQAFDVNNIIEELKALY